MSGDRAGERHGVRPRNRALCCDCGEVRTVAQFYRGKKPVHATSEVGAPRWCAWLRCAHCRAVTLHAVIADCRSEQWGSDGCERERHNRLTDRLRRRIERRLIALLAEGVTVLRAASPDDMQVADASVEVLEYDDGRGIQIRICSTATPEQLLHGLEEAEDLVDEPTRLGDWKNTAVGRWRGLSLRT